jgi:TetR/AcrR family fatty acid metabolism transcriptional regulator
MNIQARGPMSENSIDRILSAAVKLFAARGIAGVSIQEVADLAGVSAGTIIYHFKSKNNLLFILARDILVKLVQKTKTALDQADTPLECVHTYIDTFFEFAVNDRHSFSFLSKLDPFNTLDFTNFPNIDLYLIKCQYVNMFAECINDGIQQGLFTEADPKTLSLLIWTIFSGATCLYSEDVNMTNMSNEVKRTISCRIQASQQIADSSKTE